MSISEQIWNFVFSKFLHGKIIIFLLLYFQIEFLLFLAYLKLIQGKHCACRFHTIKFKALYFCSVTYFYLNNARVHALYSVSIVYCVNMELNQNVFKPVLRFFDRILNLGKLRFIEEKNKSSLIKLLKGMTMIWSLAFCFYYFIFK